MIALFCCGAAGLALLFVLIWTRKETASKDFLFFICALAVCAALVSAVFIPLAALIAAIGLFCTGAVCLVLRKKRERTQIIGEDSHENENNAESETDTNTDIIITLMDMLSNQTDDALIIQYISEQLASVCSADGGAVLLLDDFEDTLKAAVITGSFIPPCKIGADTDAASARGSRISAERAARIFKEMSFDLLESPIGKIAVEGKPLAVQRSRQKTRREAEGLYTGDADYLFIPLVVSTTLIGIAILSGNRGAEGFSASELASAKRLSDFASAILKSLYQYRDAFEHVNLQKESDIAVKLQKTLPPAQLPQIPSLSVGVYSNTSAGVCGDYYDIISCRRELVSFLVSDIPGRGMKSLIIMIMLRAVLKLTLNTAQANGKILEWINRALTGDMSLDHYASLSLMTLNYQEGTADIASCGTVPVLIYRSDSGTLTTAVSSETPIGVASRAAFESRILQLEPGDILLTYTDGLPEALGDDGSQYTAERLLNLVRLNSAKSAADIAEAVRRDMYEFRLDRRFHDDQTVLIVKAV